MDTNKERPTQGMQFPTVTLLSIYLHQQIKQFTILPYCKITGVKATLLLQSNLH